MLEPGAGGRYRSWAEVGATPRMQSPETFIEALYDYSTLYLYEYFQG